MVIEEHLKLNPYHKKYVPLLLSLHIYQGDLHQVVYNNPSPHLPINQCVHLKVRVRL
jgi:hypothetical protein